MQQATVQGRFPFKGQDRLPGDVLTADDFAGVSQTVIDALISQRLIAFPKDDDGQSPDYGLLLAKYEALSARIERAEQTHADDLDAMRLALPAAVEAAVIKAMEAFTAPASPGEVVETETRAVGDVSVTKTTRRGAAKED